MQTGIIYPTFTLGEIEYLVKFTRGGLIYRMSKANVSLADLRDPNRAFAATVDILYAVLQNFQGTKDDIADALMEDKTKVIEAQRAIFETVGKVFPQSAAAAAAGEIPGSPLKQ